MGWPAKSDKNYRKPDYDLSILGASGFGNSKNLGVPRLQTQGCKML